MSASASEYRARRGAQYHVPNSTRLPIISTWKIIRMFTVPRNSLGHAEILVAEGMEPPSASENASWRKVSVFAGTGLALDGFGSASDRLERQDLPLIPAYQSHCSRCGTSAERTSATRHPAPPQASRPAKLDLFLTHGAWYGGSSRPCRPDAPAFAQDAGTRPHPHLLRDSSASAMAAAKEPAGVIAGLLRHADGGALAGRTYIHQLPQTPPRWPGSQGPLRSGSKTTATRDRKSIEPDRSGGDRRGLHRCISAGHRIRAVAGPGFEPG
jgi:hypothetical protein